MDKDNSKYLMYINQINRKNIPNSKSNIFKKNIINFILVFLLIITSTLYYKNHSKYIQISNETTEYRKKIQRFSLALDTSKAEYNKLKNELKNEKYKNNNSFSGSEAEIFKGAILKFKQQEYSEAIDRFQYIISKGTEKSLVAESTYYVAVCFERKENYKSSEKYYISYINNFYGENYYDDSLYNYGLMLYKQGYKDKAKKVLNKLKQEVPYSIFVNSKVRYILNN